LLEPGSPECELEILPTRWLDWLS